MLLIRGEQRVADIYVTEFNRPFNHYYFRSVTEALQDNAAAATTSGDSLLLAEQAQDWLPKYAPGTYRTKRLRLYTGMAGTMTLDAAGADDR